MFGQFGSKKNPCNMRFMHYHSMHYDNFYCICPRHSSGKLEVALLLLFVLFMLDLT